MNLIPTIREALGLKENEEFQILKNDGTTYTVNYRFADNDELQWFDPGTDCWKSSHSTTLERIIYGKVTVKKLPFKPKENETYYFVHLENGDVYRTDYRPANKSDRVKVNSGNCYKTVEEAENHVDEWMTKVYGKDWKELMK